MLGKTVSDQLFGPDVDPIGQVIRVSNQPFKVDRRDGHQGTGAAWATTRTTRSLRPYTTVQKKLRGQQNIQNITVSAASADATPDVADAIAVLLRTRHKMVAGDPDDFMVRTQEEIARHPDAATRDDDERCWRASPACRCSSAASGS